MNSFESVTLQSLCVKCIASNFDTFYSLIQSSESTCASVKLIQKLYCDHILQILSSKKTIKDEYLNFLINKYTREINLQYLAHCSSFKIEQRLKEVGSGITKFSVCGVTKFSNHDCFLQYLTSIQHLELANTASSEKSLMVIAENCSNLKSLDLYGCSNIKDKGLLALCKRQPPLETLNVEYTSVSYKAVAVLLKRITSLTRLQFDNVPRAIFEAIGLNDQNGYDKETHVFNLKNLIILNNPMRPENHLTAILNVCIESCPYVKELAISELITEEQMSLCSNFKNLESVRLQSTLVIPKLCIDGFLNIRGEKLTLLSLTSFTVSVNILAQCCPNLEYLTLLHPSFENMKDTNISFPYLKVFNLQNASMEHAETKASARSIISSSPNLIELHVVCCQLASELNDVILSLPTNLTILNFSNTMIQATLIEEILKEHTGLSRIVLNNSGISSTEYDDIMDIVDDMDSGVHIAWADYAEAIRELFYLDDAVFINRNKNCVLKL